MTPLFLVEADSALGDWAAGYWSSYSASHEGAAAPNLRASHIFVVGSLSRVHLFATPWTAAHQASLSPTISWSLLKLMSIESVMPSNHPLSSPSPPALKFLSIRVFLNESVLHIR